MNDDQPHLLGPMDDHLEIPDLDNLRKQRYLRNQNVMKAFSPSIASSLAHESIRPKLSIEESAAITIQRLVRGFLARRRYVMLLFERFEQEEEERMAKTLQQCEEGELLVRNRQLWTEMDDDLTTRRNKQIRRDYAATTLQRAWRSHLARSKSSPKAMSTSSSTPSSASASPAFSHSHNASRMDQGEEEEEEEEEEATPTAITNPHVAALASAAANDADEASSFVSDYSELTEPVRAHFTASGGHVVRREDLRIGNTLPSPGSRPDSEAETEESIARKLRKHNLLSLAVEFAQLKQQDRSALPFGLHKLAGEEERAESGPQPEGDLEIEDMEEEEEEEDGTAVPMEEGSSDEPPLDDEDDYDDDADDPDGEEECELRPVAFSVLGEPERSTSEERSFPEVDWRSLEENLRRSEEEESQRQAYRLERARVLESLSMAGNDPVEGSSSPACPRRLFRPEAAGSDQDDSEADSAVGSFRRQLPRALGPRITELTKPMQLCFINDISSDEDFGSDPPTRASPRRHFFNEAIGAHQSPKLPGRDSPAPSCKGEVLLRRQSQLQAEAKIALAQAQPMAKMQLELEKQDPSAPIIREIVGLVGLRGRSLNAQLMQSLNVSQLQLLVNNFHAQIEVLNRNLMDLLLDRDDLHMEQDSKLLDVEDLTRRAQEIASKLHDEKHRQQGVASPARAAKSRLATSAASRAGAKARSTTRAVTSRLAAFFKSSNSSPAAATT